MAVTLGSLMNRGYSHSRVLTRPLIFIKHAVSAVFESLNFKYGKKKLSLSSALDQLLGLSEGLDRSPYPAEPKGPPIPVNAAAPH